MSKWHNIRDNKPEVPGNIFCVESIGQNRLFPYTSKGEYREINGINYIYIIDGMGMSDIAFVEVENGIFIDSCCKWMIRYYTEALKFPKEVIDDYYRRYNKLSNNDLVENKIINEDTWQIG